MECAYPVWRRVGDSARGEWIQTPCGICANCRKNKAHMWGARIYHESRMFKYNTFLTLTYNDENLPISEKGYSTLDKCAPSLFMKRLRYFIGDDKVRFFCGSEYGSSEHTHRPHYHLALFGIAPDDNRLFKDFWPAESGWNCDCRAWKFGIANVGELEIGSANYIGGYCLKKVMGKAGKLYYGSRGIVPPFAVMSRRPGIGAEYVQKFADEMLKFGNCQVNGYSVNLPRYYMDKINFRETDLYKQQLEKSMADAWEKFCDAYHHKNMVWKNEFAERIKIDAKI